MSEEDTTDPAIQEVDDEDVDLDGDDELLGDDEFDANTIASARSVGLNPQDFDSEDALFRATESRIGQLEKQYRSSDKPKDEFALEDLTPVLENKSDLDGNLVGAFEKLAAATGKNFKALLERIDSSPARKTMEGQLETLSKSVATLSAQNIQLRFDNWINESSEAQKYFGKGATGTLNPAGKFVKRRRACVRNAHTMANRQRGDFTMETMFTRSHKKMTAKQEPTRVVAGEGGPTRLARASEMKTSEHVSEKAVTKESMKEDAVAVINKFRKAG